MPQVRLQQETGRINELGQGPDGAPENPPERFRDPEFGPSIHQVAHLVVKPATRDGALPGLSYALKLNLRRGGLRCRLFISHSWVDGFYAFAKRALDAWPDDCEGACETRP